MSEPERKVLPVLLFLHVLGMVVPPILNADSTGRFMRGFFNTTTGAMQIPYHVVNSTFTKPLPFGVVDGVLRGTVMSLTQIVGGVFDMGAAAAPYAKYLFFI